MTTILGVSIGADGTTWCVTTDGRLHRRVGSGWQMNHDAFNVAEVAVGSNAVVWCRNVEGGLFRAITPASYNTQWTAVSYTGTNLRSISAAADGAIWAVNSLGQVLAWNGTGLSTFPESDRNAAAIAAGGRGRVLYADGAGLLYERTSVRPGISWMRVGNPGEAGVQVPVRSVSYGWNDDVWVASFSEGLYKRSVPGGIWRRNPTGIAVQVSTGGGSWVRCVNRAGDLWSAETNRYDTRWQPVPGP